jgi:hypothetical protein
MRGLSLRVIVLVFMVSCGGELLVSDEKAVERVFYEWRDSLLRGDLERTYELTSTRRRAYYRSIDEFKEEYRRYKHQWRAWLKDARVIMVAVEGIEATILVKIGEGSPRMFTARNELGFWRIEGYIERIGPR